MISRGGQSMTVVDPKVVFRMALEHQASALILGHNHPSGNLQASKLDLNLTQKLVSLGKLLEMPVLDHLILTDRGFLSMANEGLIG
ncbi:hypothetical protein D9M68_550430 [compost metagenome]